MCCSRVISWSRNSRMPLPRKVRWIWSNSALLSGRARSTPAISAPRAWESGRTVTDIRNPRSQGNWRTRCAPPVRPSRFAAASCGTTSSGVRFSLQMSDFSLPSYLRNVWHLLRDTVAGFVEDDALSRGASIAYYTLFSLAPILLIAIAIAGLAFGRDAARGAIVAQLSGLMGGKSAEALQAMVESASNPKTGLTASLVGILAAAITLTGAFGEVQSALNAIW